MGDRRFRIVIFAVILTVTALLTGCTHIIKTSEISSLQTGSPLSSIKPKIFSINDFRDIRGGKDPLLIKEAGVHTYKLDQSPANLVALAVRKELERNGHTCLSSSPQTKPDYIIDGTIFKFAANFQPQFLSTRYNSKIALKLTVSRVPIANGVLAKSYEGVYETDEGQGPKPLGTAVNMALFALIKEMSTDQDLIDFLKKD